MQLLGDVPQVLAIVAVFGVSSIVQFATGFGFALISVPLLALVAQPHQAVVLALLVGAIGDLGQAIEGRRHIEWGVVGHIVWGALAGMPLGWLVFTRSSGQVLQVTIGAVTLLTALALAAGATIRAESRRTDLATGVLVGVLTTTTGTNGPPMVALLQARRIPAPVFRATLAAIFLLIDAVALAGFAVIGRITVPTLLTTAVTIPAIVAGALVGIQARRLFSPATFRILVLALLGLTGMSAIANAL